MMIYLLFVDILEALYFVVKYRNCIRRQCLVYLMNEYELMISDFISHLNSIIISSALKFAGSNGDIQHVQIPTLSQEHDNSF